MRFVKLIFLSALIALCFYGIGRLYFQLTGGFTVGNITNTALSFDKRWETRLLDTSENLYVQQALNQEYFYLGKGCQSYVFVSADGKTVIKFPKFQRFRPQSWINLFTWLPGISEYQQKKGLERRLQMEKMFRGWTLGFDRLSKESGVLYVHVNKTPDWSTQLVIHDKLGLTHTLDLGQMEFLLQKRAIMLEDSINELMSRGDSHGVEQILDRLLAMVMFEYFEGLADNDHALLQNTGVINGRPIHIDVGQFVRSESVKKPQNYKKEIFNKTYRLHQWLETKYPSLADFLKSRLVVLLDVDYYYLPPYVYRPNFDKIPDDELSVNLP